MEMEASVANSFLYQPETMELLHAEAAVSLRKVWLTNKNIHHRSIYDVLIDEVKRRSFDRNVRINLLSLSVTSLHEAVLLQDESKVKRILNDENSRDELDEETLFGETPLYFAAYFGNVTILRLLLSAGAQVNRKAITPESELLGAVRANQYECAELLISQGSNVDVTGDDWRPIHIACFNKSQRMIEILVKGNCDVNVIGEWTYAPINLLFVEYAKRERYIQPSNDELLIYSCLKSLLTGRNLDTNYWSKCALGNPPALHRALVMLSPILCHLLLNNGASASGLFLWSQRCVHDELVMFSITKGTMGDIQQRIERYKICLQLLLQHGCEPASFGLLNTMRLLLRQLQHVPLTASKPEMEPIFRMLIDVSVNPPSLQMIARRVVRQTIRHPVQTKLSTIQTLSPRLKQFVLLYDILDQYVYD